MPTSTHSFNNDAHTVTLSIDLPKAEYLTLVDKKLKEYRKQVQIKGFRKGKAPLNLLRSKYGNSILFEELNQLIDKEVQDFIKAENLKILGNPLPKNTLKTTIQRPEDVQMNIEIGYVPEFEVIGIDSEKLLPSYEVEISEDQMEEEVEKLRKQRSFEFQEDITEVQDTDMLSVALREMEDGAVKEGGQFKESTFITLDKIADTLKSKFIGASVGDKIEASLFDLDNALDQEKALKFFYNIEGDNAPLVNETTEVEILEVKRIKLKALDADFFKEIYPQEEIEDLEAFKARLKEDVIKQYTPKIDNIYYRAIYEELMEQNAEMQLPKEFLHEWLTTSQKQQQEITDEGLDDFIKRLRWSLIVDKLSEARSIEVSKEEIEEQVRMAIAQYYNFQIPPYHPMLDEQVKQILEDQDTVRRYAEQVLENKVLRALSDDFGKELKTVSVTELEDIYTSIFNPPAEEETPKEETILEEEVTEDTVVGE